MLYKSDDGLEIGCKWEGRGASIWFFSGRQAPLPAHTYISHMGYVDRELAPLCEEKREADDDHDQRKNKQLNLKGKGRFP